MCIRDRFNGKEKTPQQSREGDVPAGPLDKTFAPLLRLLGDKSGGGGGDTDVYKRQCSTVRTT